jgi:hypothetical protein
MADSSLVTATQTAPFAAGSVGSHRGFQSSLSTAEGVRAALFFFFSFPLKDPLFPYNSSKHKIERFA